MNLKLSALLLKRSTVLGIYRFSLFIFLFLASRYLYYYVDIFPLVANAFQLMINFLTKLILEVSVLFYSWIYPDVSILEGDILAISGNGVLKLIYGCTGIIQLFQITVILLFYPINWRKKLYLYPASLIIVFFAAIVHFIMLVPIAYQHPDWFLLFHDNFSRIIFFGIVFFVWLLWETVRTGDIITTFPSTKTSSPLTNFSPNQIQPLQHNKHWIITFSLLLATVLIISYLSITVSPLGNNFIWMDKIIYFDKIIFFILYTLLCILALYARANKKIILMNLFYVILLLAIFGVVMGILQQFLFNKTGTFESLNIITNMFGIAFGALLFYFYLYHIFNKYPERYNFE